MALVVHCIKRICMAGSWNVEETKALIAIWGQENVQSQLDRVHRNRDVYQRIAMELEDTGYVKTWQQCRTKIKNLSQKYRKIKDHNNVSGNDRENREYFDDMDAILGTRATSAPVALVHSGTEDISQVPSSALNDNNDVDSDNTQAEDPDLTYVSEVDDQSLLVPDSLEQEEITGTGHRTSETVSGRNTPTVPATASGHNTPSTTSATVTTSGSNPPTTSHVGASRKKGLKRKTRETLMANELVTILHKLDRDAEERADERERKRLLIEKEEERKRLVLEAELEEKRREQERKHEMQMQAMMFNYLQQLQYVNSGVQNPSLYGSSTWPMTLFPPTDDMPPYFPPHSSPDDTNN